ncbi:MAG: DUF5615 family PIN-like protein [Pirellulaceae bacterium]|nr:DUF5615 family PIN-like protein [Pirellulaceae bacterium]
MRFLLDHGLPRTTVSCVRDIGFESEHVGELGMAAASDAAILDEGLKLNAIVATFDADFHALLAKSSASKPSVIRIRIERLKGIDVAQWIEKALRSFETTYNLELRLL